MRRNFLCWILILSFATISISFATASAQDVSSTKVMIEPVGYNIVDGHLDYKNPITNPRLMIYPGYSSTNPSIGTAFSDQTVINEMIINKDNRTRVLDTHATPYRQLGFVNFTIPEGRGGCTGALIGKDTVLTAGHCVTPHRFNITFTPGKNQDDQPFGVIAAAQVWYDKNYGQDGHDWGIIKLASPIGNETGWFGMHVSKSASLRGQSATIIGYPDDKPKGTLWKDQNVVTKTTENQVYYATDTFSGQSGAPVLDKNTSIYAIHTSGSGQQNWGTLLNEDLFNVAVNLARS